MWCTAEVVRSLCPRKEVLGSNPTHHKRGLPTISFIFLLRMDLQSRIRSPSWETGTKASSQPGLQSISLLVAADASSCPSQKPARNLSSKVILAWSKVLKTLICVSACIYEQEEKRISSRFALAYCSLDLVWPFIFSFSSLYITIYLCLAELSNLSL